MQTDCNCIICGKSFIPHPNKPNKFCSLECYHVAQRRHEYDKPRGPSKQCDLCGKEIWASYRHKRNGEKADHIFCSRACYDEYRARKLRSICPGCGKPFYKGETKTGKYCSDECWRRSQAESHIRFCVVCGQSFYPWAFRRAKGDLFFAPWLVTCSPKCQHIHEQEVEKGRREKISMAFRGEKHPSWLGGRISFRGETWKWARKQALDRDGYKYQRCGITAKQSKKKYGKMLEVHHKIPFRKFSTSEAANRLDNLITLCPSCHKTTEWEYREKEDAAG